MKQIIITIAPDGETTVETKGYSGPACKDGSKFVEDALGNKTAERLTAEYHKPAVKEQVKQ